MATTTTTVFSSACRCLALLVLGSVLVLPAGAADKDKARQTTAGKPGKVSFAQAPSHESAAARNQRLKRECQGRPNAGMCLGHTR